MPPPVLLAHDPRSSSSDGGGVGALLLYLVVFFSVIGMAACLCTRVRHRFFGRATTSFKFRGDPHGVTGLDDVAAAAGRRNPFPLSVEPVGEDVFSAEAASGLHQQLDAVVRAVSLAVASPAGGGMATQYQRAAVEPS